MPVSFSLSLAAALCLLTLSLHTHTALAYQDSGVRRVSFWPPLSSGSTPGSTPLLIDPSSFVFLDTSVPSPSDVPSAIALYHPIVFQSISSSSFPSAASLSRARARAVASATKNLAHYERFFFSSSSPSSSSSSSHSSQSTPSPLRTFGRLVRLEISAVYPAVSFNLIDTDESYTLEVPADTGVAKLNATTYAGVLRGLETFSQMVVFGVINGTTGLPPVFHLPSAPWSIQDGPRFPHRGLLVDPARTFLPIDTLKLTIDALMYSKMNVLHLHLSDSQSFPVQLSSYPNITYYGAYSQEEIYTAEEIQELTTYALSRGVRLIPEIESSSHSRVFGLAPELNSIVACADVTGMAWEKYCAEPPCGQLNPADPNTLPVLTTVLQEIASLFPDGNLHLGFDEINQACWLSDPKFLQYITQFNYTVGDALQKYFIDMHALLAVMLPNQTYSYWEEVALQSPPLPVRAVDTVQVWNNVETMNGVFNNTNANVLLSFVDDVYLDCGGANIYGDLAWCGPYHTWLSILQFDPLANVTNPDYRARVKGGEACTWGEIQGPSSVLTGAWPRTAAYGARLWHYDETENASAQFAPNRDLVLAMSDHTQRLIARGIPASPVTVPLCSINPDLCFD